MDNTVDSIYGIRILFMFFMHACLYNSILHNNIMLCGIQYTISNRTYTLHALRSARMNAFYVN
jgi:hypothetical protein